MKKRFGRKFLFYTVVFTVLTGTAAATDLQNIEKITPQGSQNINITGTVDMKGNPITDTSGALTLDGGEVDVSNGGLDIYPGSSRRIQLDRVSDSPGWRGYGGVVSSGHSLQLQGGLDDDRRYVGIWVGGKEGNLSNSTNIANFGKQSEGGSAVKTDLAVSGTTDGVDLDNPGTAITVNSNQYEVTDNSISVTELDTGSTDSRYVNRGGDSMSGGLDINADSNPVLTFSDGAGEGKLIAGSTWTGIRTGDGTNALKIYQSNQDIGIPNGNLDLSGNNVELSGGYISNDGGSEGLRVDDSGNVILTNTVTPESNNQNIRVSEGISVIDGGAGAKPNIYLSNSQASTDARIDLESNLRLQTGSSNTTGLTIDGSNQNVNIPNGNLNINNQLSVGSTECNTGEYVDGDGSCTSVVEETSGQYVNEGGDDMTGNLDMNNNGIGNVSNLDVSTSSEQIASFSSTGIDFNQPLSLDSSGPLSVANGVQLTGTSSNTLESYSTLYLTTSSGSPSDIVLDPSGEVGVDSNLSVSGNINMDSPGAIKTDGRDAISIDSNQNVEVTNGDVLLRAGSTADPSLSFSGQTNSGIYSSGGNPTISSKGTDLAKFRSDGKISLLGNSIAEVGGTVDATSGAIRMANGAGIQARNSDDSGNIKVIRTSGNQIVLGNLDTSAVEVRNSPIRIQNNNNPAASTGAIRLENNDAIAFRNNGNSGDITALSVDNSNNIELPGGNVEIPNGNLNMAGDSTINGVNRISNGGQGKEDLVISASSNKNNVIIEGKGRSHIVRTDGATGNVIRFIDGPGDGDGGSTALDINDDGTNLAGNNLYNVGTSNVDMVYDSNDDRVEIRSNGEEDICIGNCGA